MVASALNETLAVPETLDGALDPAWLTQALAPVSGGAKVTAVETVEVLRTVATKARFTVRFAGQADSHAFCLKGLLDTDEMGRRGGPTCVREADFYGRIAPQVSTRVPDCVSRIVDREGAQAIIIMRDLVAGGARFCSALEPLTADEAADSLEQIARLHAGSTLLGDHPWISRRIDQLARSPHMTAAQLQELLDGPRGEGLPPPVRSAERLLAGLAALAARDGGRREFLVHGDAHAGNLYRATASDGESGGFGLIDWQLLQRGGWALDLAYHLAAVLPIEVAEREERLLLDHYLVTAGSLGCVLPDREEAWRQFREAPLYGYYLWSITRRVDPPIIEQFVQRLGASVERHQSHRLLGLA